MGKVTGRLSARFKVVSVSQDAYKLSQTKWWSETKSKPWGEHTQQHKRQKLQVKDAVESALCDGQLKVLDVTVKHKRSDCLSRLVQHLLS